MNDDKLYNGLRVKVWKMSCGDGNFAGGYKVESVEIFSSKVIIEFSGQPFEPAYKEAEQLAIVIDAELELNGKIIRKSIKGEYK